MQVWVDSRPAHCRRLIFLGHRPQVRLRQRTLPTEMRVVLTLAVLWQA